MDIVKRAKELSLSPPPVKELIQSLADDRYIPASYEQSGIFVTEPNQMTLRSFEQILFIGTDLSQFPPKSAGDYLCSVRQREELLYGDNSYRLSAYFYRQVLRNNASVHLSSARYLDKRKLSLSPIVDIGEECKAFDISGIQGERELLNTSCRYRLDDNGEAYIESLISSEATEYDGLVGRRRFDPEILSATTLRSYSQCPLRYLLNYQYDCEAISAERDEEALEASDIGIMFHSIAERFANGVKQGEIVLPDEPDDGVKREIEVIAKSVFDDYMKEKFTDEGRPITLVHRIAYNDLVKGLYKEHHQKGLLIRFLEYIYDEGSLEHFHKSEQYFMLDKNFAITRDKSKAIVKGFIDRIDKDDEESIVEVIDYKTGKYSKDKEEKLLENMASFREFQLPLYLLYAKRAYADFSLEAFLVSFRAGDGVRSYGRIGTDEENMAFDAPYETGLKAAINSVREKIVNGSFAMTPSEENCAYCEFERICHKSVLPQKEGSDEV